MIERGDILQIVGAPDDVARAAKHIGFVERDLSATDLTFLAGGICVGMLLGSGQDQCGGHRARTRNGGFHPRRGPHGWMGAQPLSRLRRDSRSRTAAVDGHRTDRVHRDRGHARRPACRRGVSHERRRVLREHLSWRA